MRAVNPNAASNPTISSSTAAPQRSSQTGGARPAQPQSQTHATDQPLQPPDCFTLYELFTSSVVALISFFLVSDCNVVALNYRTFVSRPSALHYTKDTLLNASADLHWLTSVTAHWTSSGTFLVSTVTQRNDELRCLGNVAQEDDLESLVGKCVRVAPNGLLARVVSFEDPLDSVLGDASQRQKKRARMTTLETSINRWKSTVKRWLGWRGYSLPNLSKRESWVKIRTTQTVSLVASSPNAFGHDRDILWPRALCFFYALGSRGKMRAIRDSSTPQSQHDTLRWFETTDTTGFRDPLDLAQEWSLGKLDRDKILEARRKAKRAEEDIARRKEEHLGLYPSSPLNTRTGVYGDLQAVSGVYPTPPDGIVPATGLSYGDTPSVSGVTSNIILASGGSNPAINLSAPQDDTHVDESDHPFTSPVLPSASDNFNASSGNDDLFEDMEEDNYGGAGVNDADFDFFDGPDDEDVDMLDASALPNSKVTSNEAQGSEAQVKEDNSDPLAALEQALATESQPIKEEVQVVETDVSTTDKPAIVHEIPEPIVGPEPQMQSHSQVHITREPTPPLSPGRIAKILQPSPPQKPTSRTVRKEKHELVRDSAFNPLNFNRKMSLSDAKYLGGRFSSRTDDDAAEELTVSPAHPQKKSLRDVPLLTKLRYAIGAATKSTIPGITTLNRAASEDSDSASESSDASQDLSDDDVDDEPRTIMGSLVMPAKRKLPMEGHATPMSATSFADSLGGDWQDLHGLQLDDAALANLEPNSWDWSLLHCPPPAEHSLQGARFIMPPLPPIVSQLPDTPTSQPDFASEMLDEKSLTGKDSISIIQIVTDQIVSATLDILGEDDSIMHNSSLRSNSETCWQTIIRDVFPDSVECDLPALAAIHDVFPDFQAQAKGQQRSLPRKPNESTAIPANHMYSINPPFLRVRRADVHWDLLPPAMAFWEPLGLAPVSSPKNVVAFCIYPHSKSLRPCLENFLLNLQLAYDSCKLGNHARVETVVEFEGGLVPYRIATPTTPREAFQALKDICLQVGKLLAIQHAKIQEQQDAKIDAFVIYMVDPFGGSSSVWELCSSFWALFQAYGQGQPGRPDQAQKPDLVLQIIPIDYIASFDVPVVTDPSTYINLAREVYDRCPPSSPSGDKTSLGIYTAPAFQLEETLPRSIPFKLLSEPPQDLLRENCYMHLGYAISLDGTWLTAAWTDSCGKSQTVVSYHLGTRAFGEVAKEIWQTTIDILQSRRVHWRVCIAKAGVMDREELENWVLLISCPTQINLFIILLTVDPQPPFQFTPTISTSSTTTTGQPSTNTPGSTPQPGVSPDPTIGLTPAATPSADSTADLSTDPEARLVDVTDETWGVILAHRLHNSHSTNQFSPALISGLLVKRGESFATSNTISHPIPDPEPGPIVVGTNILWIGAVGSTRAATSPFPPSATDGVSPGGAGNAYGSGGASPSQSPTQDGVRSTSSLMWTPTVQTRTTAESLLKEVLGQFRALGLLAKLKGVRGTRHGTVPWHVAVALRGVKGLGRVMGGM